MYDVFLPHYLALGVTWNEFMHSTPNKIFVYDKAYHERLKLEDAQAHRNSYYIFEGVSLALANAFRKKGHKPKDYFEIFKKPLLQMIDEESKPSDMTEEEKRKMTEKLFTNLEIQMANFNLKQEVKNG